jgi:hypothetical protein
MNFFGTAETLRVDWTAIHELGEVAVWERYVFKQESWQATL